MKNEKVKFILGIILLILVVLWYFIIIKLWLLDLNISEKLQEIIGALISTIMLYISCINSTFSQSIKDIVKNIYNNLNIQNLICLTFTIILFIYMGMKSYGIKFKDLYREYFPYEN